MAKMIAFNEDGFSKSLYRRYNIETNYSKQPLNYSNKLRGKTSITNNNDYAMMQEVIRRRFSGKNTSNFPDLLIIDGGKGHLSSVLSVLADLDIDNISVLAISKGRERNAGREHFFTEEKDNFNFNKDEPILFFLQNLRDEVHRYAIAGHRLKSKKVLFKNPLDEIDGIGATRKKALLEEFGSAKSVGNADLIDLLKVTGISEAMAKKIFNYFND